MQQAEAYIKFIGGTGTIKKVGPKTVDQLTGGKHDTVGCLDIRAPITDEFIIIMAVDVIKLNVPFLLGLDTLDRYKIYVNNVTDELVCVNEGVNLPTTCSDGHVFYSWEWNSDILFTFPELVHIHRHFFNAKPERLNAVMRRAKNEDAVPETLQRLQDVAATCDVTQRLAKEPGRFRAALPEGDVIFNLVVLIDLMFLNGRAVLHIVNKDTLFSAATYLRDGQSTAAVWDAYMSVWVNKYADYSKHIYVDAGTKLQAVEYKALPHAAGVRVYDSGVESHNSLGAGERYHAYLRNLYNGVSADRPGIPPDMALALAVFEMNQTSGPSGLSPMLLLFGVNPPVPVKPVDLPGHSERSKAMVVARLEIVKCVGKACLDAALRNMVPSGEMVDVQPGIDVLVFRKVPDKKWEGPYKVVGVSGNKVWLDKRQRLLMYSITKVKVYNLRPKFEPADPDAAPVERETPPVRTAPADSTSDKGTIVESIIAGDTLMTNVHRAVGQLRDKAYRGASAAMQTPADVRMSEVLKSDDPRATFPEMEAACQSEADGLFSRGAFWRRLRTSVSPNVNVLGGRMVKVIKRVNTVDVSAKTRFIGQGNTEKATDIVVHNLSALRQRFTKILVSTSAVLGFRIFFHNVTQAFLQIKDKLSRKVFVRPRARDARDFGVRDDEVLQVLLPLHGLPDEGDYWEFNVLDHVEIELGMESRVSDPRLFVKDGSNAIQGLLGGCENDFLMNDDTHFQNLTENSLQRFDLKPRVWDNMEFIGVSIKTAPGPPRVLFIDQKEYIDKARKPPLSIIHEKFVSMRAAFA